MAIPRLQLEHTALLVVDLQEKLLPAIHEHEQVVQQCSRLIDAANALGLPVLVTEQYKKGLGDTVPTIRERLGEARCCLEKLKFSACIEPVREILQREQIRTVIVCGVETHVCVLQTCLDLAEMGLVAAVAVDATGSRRPLDRDTAITRMTQAGVVPVTIESAIFDMVREAGTERFKSILPIVKG